MKKTVKKTVTKAKAKSFTEEWNDLLGTAKVMLLPPYRPTMLLSTDTSTRESNCRQCNGRIPVKSKRIIAMVKVPAQKAPNGGTIYGKKYFYHQACFTGFLGRSKYDPANSRCGRCGKFQKSGEMSHSYVTRSTYTLTPICKQCVVKEDLQKCSQCNRYALHSLLSPIVEQDAEANLWISDKVTVGNLCCDSCAASWYIRRAKEQRKIDMEDERFDKKMLEIRELMIKNEFF